MLIKVLSFDLGVGGARFAPKGTQGACKLDAGKFKKRLACPKTSHKPKMGCATNWPDGADRQNSPV